MVSNKCPHCGDRLIVKRDAVLSYKIDDKGNVADKYSFVGEYDDVWVECAECCLTSNEDKKLEEIFKQLNFKT